MTTSHNTQLLHNCTIQMSKYFNVCRCRTPTLCANSYTSSKSILLLTLTLEESIYKRADHLFRIHSSIDNQTINMKLIVLSALISACAAASFNAIPPQYRYYPDLRPRAGLERSAAILRSESDVNERGFSYAYDTENGIHADETGVEANGIQASGGYSYTGDDGQVYSVRYTADSNGFQPVGAHIPTPPPVPEAIARALQENARDEAAGIFDDGSYHEGKYSPAVIAARTYQPQRFIAPRYRPIF